MIPSQQTYFISDLHLSENRPDIAQKFFDLLKRAPKEANALYILGDLFEAWIGDDDCTPFHRDIFEALQTATATGLPIYFLHGNRDFLVSQRFFKCTGCAPLLEEEKITLYGTPFLLMHGDTLCTLDHAYQRTRKIFHNRVVQKLFLMLPLSFRRKVANKLRARSSKYMQQLPKDWMDVSPKTVATKVQKHNVPVLIHGHTHKPAIHAEHTYTRIVLGAWHEGGNMLICNSQGKQFLVDF